MTDTKGAEEAKEREKWRGRYKKAGVNDTGNVGPKSGKGSV